MAYEYITKDNLEEPQKYSYTSYRGRDFLEDYLLSRKPYVTDKDYDLRQLIELMTRNDELPKSDTFAELSDILFAMNNKTDTIKDSVDKYVKRFELRKRLFGQYIADTNKPDIESGYREYGGYILLGAVVEAAYAEWGSLKYINTLLKIDDTLLSLMDKLNEAQRDCVCSLLSREVAHVKELAARKKVAL